MAALTELPAGEGGDALGQGGELGRLGGDDEVAELVPRSLERQEDDRDEGGTCIGSTTDQKMRNVPAPSMRACSSTEGGIDSKKFFMMNTPAASTRSGRIMPAYES